VTDSAPFNPSALLGVLLAHSVDFVMIGGYAAELQGVSWMTLDIDIVIAACEENYLALEAALLELDAWCLMPPGSIQRIRPDAGRLRSLTGAMLIRTRFGRLDIMKNAGSDDAPRGYEELATDALEAEVGGRTFLVASLDALLSMKRAAGRPKDRAVLSRLEEAIAKKHERDG
jgi:hypothetical protein